MNTYRIYKLKNENSIIGFPLIALCQSDSSYMQYSEDVITIDPNFSDQHETDIDSYLEDYTPTETLFSFSFENLISELTVPKEIPVSLTYWLEENSFTICYHRYRGSNAYDQECVDFPKGAQSLIHSLKEIFIKSLGNN